MNKKIIVQDKNNNIKKEADTIIKFNFENKDYLIYSIEENEENRQIFVSKLILNSEGKYFIDNILPEEKGKLNNIVYNIVILTPTEAKKGIDGLLLINGLTDKFSVKLSTEIPELGEQEYYSNCSIAITSKILVEDAIKFYEENLATNTLNGQTDVLTPTWTLPIENTNPEPVVTESASIESSPITPNVEPVVQNIPVNTLTTNDSLTPHVPETQNNNLEGVISNLNENPNIIPTELNSNNIVPQSTTIDQQVSPQLAPSSSNQEPQAIQSNNQLVDNLPNPQIDKLGGNVAIVSDPSLENVGVAVQPNVGKMKKAGFAINKYIIIGTVCLLLAVAVVVVAYILIQKKTTGV